VSATELMPNDETTPPERAKVVLSGSPLTIDQVHDVAVRERAASLSRESSVGTRMQRARALVDRAVDEGWQVYGVTTGFGGMADVAVPAELASASQHNLLAFLAAGAGRPVAARHVRAAMLLRANMLLLGCSGVRLSIVERLVRFLAADAVPVVRELGSIGASGDLVPLATIARAITGQGGSSRVTWCGEVCEGKALLERLKLSPLSLAPKEALAIVNGTSFSSAIAANCVYASQGLLALTLATHAMMWQALCGRRDPLAPFIHACKPHPGQVWTAAVMQRLTRHTADAARDKQTEQVQDRYAVRCLPQYLGPIVEGLARIARTVETEMNSVTDNPLVDVEAQAFHQGGNFLGQYLGMAMDDLRRCLGLLAKHLDVQIAQLVTPQFSHGLPPSLKGNQMRCYCMGLKGLQITANSIMPLLTYQSSPLVQHYPTHAEQYNQNVNGLSWGSANLAWQSVELYQQYLAIALIFAVQAIDLRAGDRHGHFDGYRLLTPELQCLYQTVYASLGSDRSERKPLVFNDIDQSLEEYVSTLADKIIDETTMFSAVQPLLDEFKMAELTY